MSSKVLIFCKGRKPAAKEAVGTLKDWLKKKAVDVVDVSDGEERLEESAAKGVSLGVVIGGDGTFLTLVRRLEKKDQFPIMGVNLGTLGFITEINKEEMIQAVADALEKKFQEERRPLLQVDVWRGKKCVESAVVFNDAVMTKDAQTTMLKFDVFVGGELLSYVRADGYIISTPTGSTAYSLSAGGPLVHPEVPGIVLVPICSHALSTRPTLVPQKTAIEIVTREFAGAVYLVYDGQVSFELKAGDQIKVRLSESSLRLIRSPEQKWSETIRTKLKMT